MDGNICSKIARLVEERGWNQDEFARISGLNRLTVRGIFQADRKLHNATVAVCATSLGFTVHELKSAPVERLLPKPQTTDRRRFEEITQPELLAWSQENPAKANELSADEWDELLSLQGTGGPLTGEGVGKFVELIERKRRLAAKVAAIAGTDQIDLLEEFVDFLYRKVQPYAGRQLNGNTSE